MSFRVPFRAQGVKDVAVALRFFLDFGLKSGSGFRPASWAQKVEKRKQETVYVGFRDPKTLNS